MSGYATTNFPNGITSWGVPIFGGNLPLPNSSGSVWFVSSTAGNNGNDGSFNTPFATLAYAATKAGISDVIALLPGHAEAVIAAGTVTLSTAGVQVIGLGTGSKRPTFTFSTATTASILVSGAGVNISNVVGVAGINNLANPIDVTGGTPTIQIEWQDVSTTYQAISCVRMTAVTNAKLNLKYLGTAGSAVCLNPVQLAGCTVVEVNIDFYGTAGTAVVNTVATGASKDVVVYGYIYNSGTTTGAKNFVDTVTGSTWFINVDDGAAGQSYVGGSAFAPALGDTAAIANALYGTAGVATWPTAAAYASSVSISEVLGYIQDAVRNGSGTGMPTNKSIVDLLGAGYTGGANLTLQAALGTDGTTPVSATGGLFGAIGINNATNNFVSSAVTVNRTGSMFGRMADLIDQQDKCVATTAATMAQATDTLFTIAGGPILMLSLVGIFQTVNTAAASTFIVQSTGTAGNVTVVFGTISGSTSGAAAGTMITLPASSGSAIIVSSTGANLNLLPATGWNIPVGTIQAIVGTAGTAGTVQWFLRYRPLAPGVTITAGY
jgi:hypothetical protein